MAFTIYDASVPVLSRALANLKGVLNKGADHAANEKIDPAVLIQSRLYPDMLPLSKQVQIATDNAKGCVARLAVIEAPKFEDTEASFAELQARIDKTIALLEGFKPAQFEGAGERAVVMKMPNRTLNFPNGWDYLQRFVLPNVYFHSTTAYDILRHSGVKLGKGDFLGNVG